MKYGKSMDKAFQGNVSQASGLSHPCKSQEDPDFPGAQGFSQGFLDHLDGMGVRPLDIVHLYISFSRFPLQHEAVSPWA